MWYLLNSARTKAMRVGKLKGPLMMSCVPQPIVGFNNAAAPQINMNLLRKYTYRLRTSWYYLLHRLASSRYVNRGAKRKPSNFMADTDLSAGVNAVLLFH